MNYRESPRYALRVRKQELLLRRTKLMNLMFALNSVIDNKFLKCCQKIDKIDDELRVLLPKLGEQWGRR